MRPRRKVLTGLVSVNAALSAIGYFMKLEMRSAFACGLRLATAES